MGRINALIKEDKGNLLSTIHYVKVKVQEKAFSSN
jgi:hypothetical protein